MQKATKAQIREHLGHGTGYRRVRIHNDGRVTYYGSTDPFDRSHDYWHDGGHVSHYRIDTETGLVRS